jgi:integrase
MGVFKQNGNWFIDYRVNGQRRQEKIGTSKELAGKVLNKRKTEIAEGRFLDIKREKKHLFAEAAERFLTYSKTNKRSYSRDLLTVNKHLLPAFGTRLLRDISSWDVEKFKAQRKLAVKTTSVNRELTCLKTIFNKAILWGMVAHNPVKGIKLFKERQRDRFLMTDEIRLLLDNYPHHYRPLVVTALHTGMRLGEILNLSWDDVDFRAKQILVRDSKNGESRRIEMNDALTTELRRLKDASTGTDVFVGLTGARLQTNAISRVHRYVCRKAGIKDFRFHDLRHTFASHLVMNGVDLTTVSKLLGHKTLQMTLRYSHLAQAHKQKAVDTLNGYTDGDFLETSAKKTVSAQFGNGS